MTGHIMLEDGKETKETGGAQPQETPPATPASQEAHAPDAPPPKITTRQRIKRRIFFGVATGKPDLLKCGDTNWTAAGKALKRMSFIVMPQKSAAAELPAEIIETLPAPQTEATQLVLPIAAAPALYHTFPFPMSGKEKSDALRWANKHKEYDVARVIQDYIDYEFTGYQKDKFAWEISRILEYPNVTGPLKAALNGGGDPSGWNGSHLVKAIRTRQTGAARLLLAAGADPYEFGLPTTDELRDRGLHSIADALEARRDGLPIMKYQESWIAAPQSQPSPQLPPLRPASGQLSLFTTLATSNAGYKMP